MVYTYIKYDIPGFYAEFTEQFDPALYNNLGTTWEDFKNNLWVLLSPEQVAFHVANPSASITEVWNMEITPDSIEIHKSNMIANITNYDMSSEVNGFLVNGQTAWLTPNERANYSNSIESARILGMETIMVNIAGQTLTMTLDQASAFLAQIQIYADSCYFVTENHKKEVNALETIEEVDAYDYKAGYPDKLSFVINDDHELRSA
jgi:hypothetical protein